ncbi:MAG: hypothetical protein ABR537_10950 [Gemmatimonadales bacterium]
MKRTPSMWVALLCAALAFPGRVRAQAASAVLTQGVQAYDDLDFEQAAGLLRRALAVQGSGALTRDEASRTLIYLTATELLRDRKDSARAIARRLVIANPRFRPDELLFPPQLLLLYEVVRRATPAVIGEAPADTTIRPGDELFTLRLYASAVHDVVATLQTQDGRVFRTLYRGPIGDSLAVQWNGLDSSSATAPSGLYAITVTSLDRGGHVVRMLRMPLRVLSAPVDTLAHPPAPADTVLLPERRPLGAALRVAAPGLLGGVGALVLPNLIARGEQPSSARFLIGGSLAIAGVAALVTHHPGRAIPENVSRNAAIRAWRAQVAEVTRRNAERAKGMIGLHVDPPVILTPAASGP